MMIDEDDAFDFMDDDDDLEFLEDEVEEEEP